MPARHEQIAQLEAAISAQEALRATLGDQAVDAVLAAVRAQLAALRAQAAGSSLDDELLELQSADLIRRLVAETEPAYSFKHALTQDAAYSSLLFAERKALHAAVAHVLESFTAQRTWAQALAALDRAETADAEAHLAESVRLMDAGGALLEAAHTHAAWGALLRARDPEAARKHLDTAIRQFEASGLPLPAEQARSSAAIGGSNSLPARLKND